MTQPELPAEADHDREAGDPPIEKRDPHLGSENPHRAPVKETNDPSHADIPGSDMDRGSEEVPPGRGATCTEPSGGASPHRP